MFPAATAVTVARNVAHRGVLVIFVFVFKFCQVPLRFLTVCQGLPRQRLAGALRSATNGSTFHPGLPRSVWTSHVLLRCDQVLLRLSSSVKVFYNKSWAMKGV